MKPEPYARALRGVLADLAVTTDGATYLASSIAGLRQRYDLGGGNPLVGRSAPELTMADGSRLADHLHHGAGVLVRPTGSASSPATDPSRAADPTSAGPSLTSAGPSALERLRVVEADAPGMLVRPDGVVAWVEGDGDLGDALRRWFGDVRVEAVAAMV
ncbi:hypothetical protein ACIA5D_22820 [Actinoplanes sp. NPDC051513]|uniref:aromatic-ring hydroxylase C-terminal domain-containing protein n=1 Tax=Actinoplanes sp. NPDC051513 TaxID=3363908 RepID=UPI00379F7A08